MKVYTDFVPEHSPYLTPCKRYEVFDESNIIDDDGDILCIFIPECSHLDFNAWSIEH